jgi:RNA polymerase sigma factor (TIGR02999 family)
MLSLMTEHGRKHCDPITRLLERARAGDGGARDELFGIVYADLRQAAEGLLAAGNWPRDAMGGTELVNTACMRLLDRDQMDAENRRHFFFLLGRAMHDVLVEEARSATAAKRGGGKRPGTLVEFAVDGETTVVGMLELSAAIAELHEADPEAARVVRLRYFCGRSLRDTAELMGSSLAVTRRHWDYARAWLRVRLGGERKGGDEPDFAN